MQRKIRLATADFYGSVKELFERLSCNDFCLFQVNEKPDLIVFSGGADISPSIYGERNYASHVNPARDAWETTVYTYAVENHIPCLGICRGHQLLNALSGGKLVQNITDSHPGIHNLVSELFPIVVNSYHHQGVVSTPLEVLAMYKDIAEITFGNNIFSVQFHPEFDTDRDMDEVVKKGLEMLW